MDAHMKIDPNKYVLRLWVGQLYSAYILLYLNKHVGTGILWAKDRRVF